MNGMAKIFVILASVVWIVSTYGMDNKKIHKVQRGTKRLSSIDTLVCEELSKLTEDDKKIRAYFLAKNKILLHFENATYNVSHLNNMDALIRTFPRPVYSSSNIASDYASDKLLGDSSCVIELARSGKIIAANRSRIIKKNKSEPHDCYRLRRNQLPVCSLAYARGYIVAGHYDGSLTIINERKHSKVVLSHCHRTPITSILYLPSQKVCVLGGGSDVEFIRIFEKNWCQDKKKKGHCTIKRCDLGEDSTGEPYIADIVALAGPCVILLTKKSEPIAVSLYSRAAFNAIQSGRLSDEQKTFLVRVIDDQKKKKPVELSVEDKEELNTLCPTLQEALCYGWKDSIISVYALFKSLNIIV
jgi:hypothetical protein